MSSFVIKFSLISLIVLATNITARGQIIFQEEALARGINHTYLNGQSAGGVSFVDFNGDGLDDLTLATAKGDLIHFYRNNGNGFSRNPPLVGNFTEQKQILWADYDNDGDKDLFICAKGDVNRLYQNNGDMEMIDITESSGLPLDSLDTFNACWADFNRDGWLDLYVCERVPLHRELNRNYLFFNNADGTFTDVSEETNSLAPRRLPFSSSALDYNNDMWPDIYIANDKNWVNVLLKNEGDGVFSDVSTLTGSDYEMDGMSVALGDYDQDGDSDIYITNSPEGNVLAQNDLDSFINVAEEIGISFGGTAWGANFLDAENDGDIDLYVSGSDFGSAAISAAFYEQIDHDSFTLVSEGFDKDTVVSYANAVGDFNDDGLPDLVVVNWNGDKSFLFANHSASGNYLKVELEGVLSNRDGIGSLVEIYHDTSYQTYYTHSGVGFLAQNSDQFIFGIGESLIIDSLKVSWSSGHVDIVRNIAPNALLSIIEGSSTNGEIKVSDGIEIKPSNFPSSISNEFTGETDFKIFPNPFQDHFKIISGHGEEIRNYEIFNLTGQLVNNTSSLPPGIYIIKVLFYDSTTLVKRVVKI